MDQNLDKPLAVNEKWDLSDARYIIVNGVLVFSGQVMYLGNMNKKDTTCKLFEVKWNPDYLMLKQDAKMWAACNSSMHGPLRTQTNKFTAKAEIWLTPSGLVELRNNGYDACIPKTIFLSGLYFILEFVHPDYTLPLDEFELTISAPSPERWFKHPTCMKRGNMIYMSGGQGTDTTRYGSDGRVLCRYPSGRESYLPAPRQTLRYDIPCGWEGKATVSIKIGDEGVIRAYGQSNAGCTATGHMTYDHMLYSTDKGQYVGYAGCMEASDEKDEMEGWDSDSDVETVAETDDNEFTTSITWRQVKGCVFFLQGHIDLGRSAWKERHAIARIKYCPMVRETYLINGHRIDIAPDGRIFLPEATRHYNHNSVIDLNFFVVATKAVNLNDESGDLDQQKIKESLNIVGVMQWGKRRHQEYSTSCLKTGDHERFLEVQKFFLDHETNGTDITHPCLAGGWRNDFTKTGKWHFPDDDDTQWEICTSLAWLFSRGIPFFMCERQTDQFPFIEDLDIQAYGNWDELGGMKNENHSTYTLPPDYAILIPPEIDDFPGKFMVERAMCIHKIYPQFPYLEALVYQASGYNRGKELLKTSFHLVWSDVIVDNFSAPKIREDTLAHFVDIAQDTSADNGYWLEFAEALKLLHPSNSFDMVFDKTTVTAKNGLRMPFNDKAKLSKSKMWEGGKNKPVIEGIVIEGRPQLPVGVLRFEFEKNDGVSKCTKAAWIKDRSSMDDATWIRKSTCRRPVGTMATVTGEDFQKAHGSCDFFDYY